MKISLARKNLLHVSPLDLFSFSSLSCAASCFTCWESSRQSPGHRKASPIRAKASRDLPNARVITDITPQTPPIIAHVINGLLPRRGMTDQFQRGNHSLST
jgi:hypothetical protein